MSARLARAGIGGLAALALVCPEALADETHGDVALPALTPEEIQELGLATAPPTGDTTAPGAQDVDAEPDSRTPRTRGCRAPEEGQPEAEPEVPTAEPAGAPAGRRPGAAAAGTAGAVAPAASGLDATGHAGGLLAGSAPSSPARPRRVGPPAIGRQPRPPVRPGAPASCRASRRLRRA